MLILTLGFLKLIVLLNNFNIIEVNCDENATIIESETTTVIDNYDEYLDEETEASFSPNNVIDEMIDDVLKLNNQKEDDNIMINWSKTMTGITDTIYAKLIPIAMRYQYEDRNVSQQCMKNIVKIMFALKNQETWAAKFADSMGKMQSGILEGTLTSFGDYDECLDIEYKDSIDDGFYGKYCLLSMIPELNPKTRIIKQRDRLFNLTSTVAEGTLFEYISNVSAGLYSVGALRVGICVPSNCQSGELEALSDEFIKNYKLKASVSDKCMVKYESEPLTVHQTVSFSLLTLMVFFVIIGTICEYFKFSKWFIQKIFISWSVIRNINKLITVSPQTHELSALHGMRVLTMFWVVVNHTYLFGGLYPIRWTYRRLLLNTYVVESFFFLLVFNAWILVDSFFFFSGLLVIYGTLPMIEKNSGRFNFPLFVSHRLIRIIPALSGVIAIHFLWPIIINGPALIDNMTVDYLFKSCEKNWWKNLLLINNWSNPRDICLINTWHVSADTQMLLGSILIIIAFYWNCTYGLVVNGTVLLISIILSGVVTYRKNLYPTIVNDHTINLDYVDEHLKYAYLPTYQHFGPYCMGIFVGYFILNKPKNFQISKKMNLLGWTLLPALSLAVILISHPWNNGSVPSMLTSVLYASLHRNIWCIGLSWITLMCAYGRGGIVNKLLSHQFWVPLSRLSFGVFLVHLVVIFMRYLTHRTTLTWSHSEFLNNSMVNIILSNGLSLFIYLILEAPFINLEKLLFANLNKSVKTDKSVVECNESKRDKIERHIDLNLSFKNLENNNENGFDVIKL